MTLLTVVLIISIMQLVVLCAILGILSNRLIGKCTAPNCSGLIGIQLHKKTHYYSLQVACSKDSTHNLSVP